MNQAFIMITSYIGIACLGLFALLLCANAFDAIKDFIRRKRYEYKRKHRFDKQPIAKCYCVDCKFAKEINGGCYICTIDNINHRCDDWFCADGDPRIQPREEE